MRGGLKVLFALYEMLNKVGVNNVDCIDRSSRRSRVLGLAEKGKTPARLNWQGVTYAEMKT